MVKFVIEAGADVMATNGQNLTPLDVVNQYTDPRSSQELKKILQGTYECVFVDLSQCVLLTVGTYCNMYILSVREVTVYYCIGANFCRAYVYFTNQELVCDWTSRCCTLQWKLVIKNTLTVNFCCSE